MPFSRQKSQMKREKRPTLTLRQITSSVPRILTLRAVLPHAKMSALCAGHILRSDRGIVHGSDLVHECRRIVRDPVL